MNAHTLGPWFVGAQNDQLFVVDKRPATSNDYPQHDAETAFIAKVYDGNACEANARLIAAAPEMLSAIGRLADDLEDGHWSETKAYLRDLIARATGAA